MLGAILRRLLPDTDRPDGPELRRRCGVLAGGVGVAAPCEVALGSEVIFTNTCGIPPWFVL